MPRFFLSIAEATKKTSRRIRTINRQPLPQFDNLYRKVNLDSRIRRQTYEPNALQEIAKGQ
jgi:hypothetical protein